MNKTMLVVGIAAAALIAAGTIHALQNKQAPLAPGATAANTPSVAVSGQDRILVPNGTAMSFKLSSGLYTKTSNVGDTFQATVASPVSVDGHVAIPEGANVSGHVILARQPGKASGRGQLQVEYDKLTFGGHSYDLGMRSQVYESKSGTKKDVALVGGGAVAGGVVGAILGGKGSVGKGAAVGAAAGTGTSLMTRGPQLELEAGTVLNADLDEALRVRRS